MTRKTATRTTALTVPSRRAAQPSPGLATRPHANGPLAESGPPISPSSGAAPAGPAWQDLGRLDGEEQLRHLGVAAHGGEVERQAALVVDGARIQARVQQQPRRVELPRHECSYQRRIGIGQGGCRSRPIGGKSSRNRTELAELGGNTITSQELCSFRPANGALHSANSCCPASRLP